MEEKKTGYFTSTYKLCLYNKHLDWLKETKHLYNRTLEFYYRILGEHLEWMEYTNHNLLRELEILTVGTREMKKTGKQPIYPLEGFPVIPLYFRRAAINHAISMMRSFLSLKKSWEQKPEGSCPSMARSFEASPVYYKGMYRAFGEESIQLKLYTGKAWKWIEYHFQGRKIPEQATCLSPTIHLENKRAYLHVPVVQPVKDIRTMQERMQQEKKILALAFPGNDAMAAGAVMGRDGFFIAGVFFKGGGEMKAKKQVLRKKMQKQQERETSEKSRRYQEKFENLNDHYAHFVSRRILDYCKQEEIRIITVPNYERGIDFAKKRYLKTDNFEWIGRRIIRYLKYKAFGEGILVSSVRAYHISDVCSECGAKIKRYNEGHSPGSSYYGGKLFVCPNGHRGNSGLNTAKNVGNKFLSYYESLDEIY